MEHTEIASLYRAVPADGTVLTVCGWAKNIRDSKNIGFIALYRPPHPDPPGQAAL